MKLERPDGCYFEMSILGYQFPAEVDAEYDSNWLNVRISVKDARGSWRAVDPALLTYEAGELVDWLRGISSGGAIERNLSFMEPCLSFRLTPRDEKTEELIVTLSYEYRPPWASNDLGVQHMLAFPLSGLALNAAANSLEQELSQYPQRAKR